MIASLHRSAQLGLISKDFALSRIRKSSSHTCKKRLVERLGLMHGLPQKIGQLLAFSEIESSDSRFTSLTEGEATMTKAEALGELERQLGTKAERILSYFNPKGISASIGQVHRATTIDGRDVAIKIQHPHISESIRYDLKALGWLMKPVSELKDAFDIGAYRQEIGESLESELDYKLEAQRMERFSTLLNRTHWNRQFSLSIPTGIADLSNSKILTTNWIQGDNISRFREWSAQDRAAFAHTLVEFFLRSLLDWGLVHSDPHPGNYRFYLKDGKPTVGLLDFGCVKDVPPNIQLGLREMVFRPKPEEWSKSEALDLFANLGFDMRVLHPMKDKLIDIANVLSLPFNRNSNFDTTEWNLAGRLKSILEEDRISFRLAGPPEILFILRSFQGLLHYLKILNSPVNWKQTAQRVEESATISQSERSHLDNHTKQSRAMTATTQSDTLHILVTENGSTKANLTFGANATDVLPDLIPHQLRDRISLRGIDLEKIATIAKKSNYSSGVLFNLEEDSKSVCVWLD